VNHETDWTSERLFWEEALGVAQLRADLERVKVERDDLRAESETHICRLEDELAEVRAALERVTAERDEAIQHRNQAQGENVGLRVSLSETKAALEARAGYDAWMRTAKALGADLDQLRRAWAEQLRDLLPRVGLRALYGVPDEVKALLGSEKGASDGE